MNEKDLLSQFISEIVYAEMDENQQSIFEFDGKDRIDFFFDNEKNIEVNEQGIALDFGFGPTEINEVMKNVLEAASLIVSVLSLYLTFRKDKKEVEINELKELKEEWKSKLVLDHNVDPEIAELLVNKYAHKLLKIIK